MHCTFPHCVKGDLKNVTQVERTKMWHTGFPVDPIMAKKWIEIINNPKLLSLDPAEIYKKQLYVCSRHFEEKFLRPTYIGSTGKKVKPDAIPTLCLRDVYEVQPLRVTANILLVQDDSATVHANIAIDETSPAKVISGTCSSSATVETSRVKGFAHSEHHTQQHSEEISVDDQSTDENNEPQKNIPVKKRRLTNPPELQKASKHITQTFERLNNALNDKQNEDECDLYARLLASKLRQFRRNEREEIMYEIDGLLLNRRYLYNPSSSS